jgi:broad specificity phosphatase PhoE
MLIVVRHGKSISNAGLHRGGKHLFTDDNNVLTSVGVEGALRAGDKIKDITKGEINHVITSDLPRAKQTTYTIVSSLGAVVPIILEPKLKEIQWCRDGIYRDFEYRNLHSDIHYRPFEDSENQFEVYERACRTILEYSDKLTVGNNVLVSHYMVLRAIMAIKDTNNPLSMTNYDPKNTDPVLITEKGIHTILENAEKYLKTIS